MGLAAPGIGHRDDLQVSGAALLSGALYIALGWSQRGLMMHAHRRLSFLAYVGALCGLFAIYTWVLQTSVLRRSRRARSILVGAPIVFALGWLFYPPALSIDVYSYLADGYLWRNGMNPYLHGVRELGGTVEGVALGTYGWRPVHGISPYGPLWMLIEVAVGHASIGITHAVLLLKGIVVSAGILAAAAIYSADPDATREERLRALLLFAWNPAVITELAGEGHNDAVMVLAVVLGLRWIVRRRTVAGALAMSAGVLAKYVPILFAIPTVVYLWRTREDTFRFWRTVGVCVLLCAAFAAALYAPLWAGPDTLSGLRAAGRTTFGPGTPGALVWGLSRAFSPQRAVAATGLLTTGVLLALIAVVSVHVRDRRTLFDACGTIALGYVLIASPRFWPWYVVLPTALLALTPTRRNVQLVIVLSFCAKLVAPLDILRVLNVISWPAESALMTVLGVWLPLLAWAAMHFRRGIEPATP